MEKRYQVFVSSTYADLKEERRNVVQALMDMDCIPAGMEMFPATDQDQFDFIKKIINDCDYYLLIVGGRYGSLTDAGISYTEREYDYAVGKGMKVLAFLHGNPDAIPYGLSEKDPALREKLAAFCERVKTGRIVKFWEKAEELPGQVALSLSKTIKTFPAIGWIRADVAASAQVLGEINELRKQNAQLLTQIGGKPPKFDIPDLAGLDEKFTAHGRFNFLGSMSSWAVTMSWREIFSGVSPYLTSHLHDTAVKRHLAEIIQARYQNRGSSPSLNDQDFKTITIQLQALGLVSVKSLQTKGGMAEFWKLTPDGEHLMVQLRAIRTAQTA